MPDDPPRHELHRVETVAGRGCRAVCSCGWTSLVAMTAAVAGRLWDDHAAEDDR